MTNREDWLEYRPTELDVRLANELADKTIRATTARGAKSNFDVGDKLETERIGSMGELIFRKYLAKNFAGSWKYLGGIGEPDFRILSMTLDVKTNRFSWPVENIRPGYSFFIAVQQMEKSTVDYFINIQAAMDKKIYYVIGYISRVAAKEHSIRQDENMVNPAHAIPFPHLKPLRQLLTEIQQKVDTCRQ
jgi:hypothetical protein